MNRRLLIVETFWMAAAVLAWWLLPWISSEGWLHSSDRTEWIAAYLIWIGVGFCSGVQIAAYLIREWRK